MSNSVVTLSSFNLLFFTQVLTVLSSTIKYTEYVTDKGKNISIPCTAVSFNIMWVKDNGNYSTIVQNGKYLTLTNVTTSDEGVYICFAEVTSRPTVHTNEVEQRIVQNDTTLRENSDGSSKSTIAETETHAINSSLLSSSSSSSSSSSAPLDFDGSSSAISKENLTYEIMEKNSNKAMPITRNHTRKYASTTTSMLPNSRLNATVTNYDVTTTTITSILSNGNSNSGSSNRSDNINNNQNSSRHFVNHSTNISTSIAPPTSTTTTPNEFIEQEFRAIEKVYIKVRTTPGPVSQLYFKASTILGFLIWRFNPSNSGGYTIRSFTAEYRNVSYKEKPFNASFEHEWIRMDPINIAPNVRQMEVYHLEPNTTYEFRIWANNQLGSGEVVTTNVTTLPETREEDLIRLIQPDLDNFDPRVWIIAVSIVLGTLVILGIGLCVVLTRECYQSRRQEFQDGWDGIELIPNIILNPSFHETDSDSDEMIPNLRTIIFRSNNNNNNESTDDDDSYDSESDHEPRIEKFKRKLSVFFTDPTIRRI